MSFLCKLFPRIGKKQKYSEKSMTSKVHYQCQIVNIVLSWFYEMEGKAGSGLEELTYLCLRGSWRPHQTVPQTCQAKSGSPGTGF